METPTTIPSKIIQIAVSQHALFALCEDGSVWRKPCTSNFWKKEGLEIQNQDNESDD